MCDNAVNLANTSLSQRYVRDKVNTGQAHYSNVIDSSVILEGDCLNIGELARIQVLFNTCFCVIIWTRTS